MAYFLKMDDQNGSAVKIAASVLTFMRKCFVWACLKVDIKKHNQYIASFKKVLYIFIQKIWTTKFYASTFLSHTDVFFNISFS